MSRWSGCCISLNKIDSSMPTPCQGGDQGNSLGEGESWVSQPKRFPHACNTLSSPQNQLFHWTTCEQCCTPEHKNGHSWENSEADGGRHKCKFILLSNGSADELSGRVSTVKHWTLCYSDMRGVPSNIGLGPRNGTPNQDAMVTVYYQSSPQEREINLWRKGLSLVGLMERSQSIVWLTRCFHLALGHLSSVVMWEPAM